MNLIKEDQLVRVNSYSLSLVLASSFIANCLTATNIYHDGIIPLVTLGSILVVFICHILFGLTSKIELRIFSLFLFGYIGLFFLISVFMEYGKSYYYLYLNQFLFFGGTAFIYSTLKIDFEKTLRGISLITLLVFINPVKIIAYFIVPAADYIYIPMGISYSILPCVIGSFLHFIFYKGKRGVLLVLSYFINLILFFIILLHGTRGVVLSLLIFFGILFLTRKKKKLGYILNFITSMVLIYILANYQNVMMQIFRLTSSSGIEITALSKTLLKMDSIGILNNRSVIYDTSLTLIYQRPIFGYGIGYFASMFGGWYPHNLFLQIFIEFGILFSVPIVIFLLYSLVVVFRKRQICATDRFYWAFIFFCFISSVPRLMFSSYLWQDLIFWFLVFFLPTPKLLPISSKGV